MHVFAVPFNPKIINPAFVKAFDNMKAIFARMDIKLIVIDCRFDDEQLLSKKVNSILGWVDGLIFPGNPYSIDPNLYGEKPLHPKRIDPEPRNFQFVSLLINRAIEKRIPILGICAGSWSLNVAQGGSLNQEITHFDGCAMTHCTDPRNGKVVHQIKILPNTTLSKVLKQEHTHVNSWHDQSIGRLGLGLRKAAVAPDGVVEAIEGIAEDSFCMGIQFHPEYLLSGQADEGYLSPSDIAKQRAVFSFMAQAAKQRNGSPSLSGVFWAHSSSKSRAIAYHASNTDYLLNRFNAIRKFQFC